MAYIPMEDVHTLWDSAQERSWRGLGQVLRSAKRREELGMGDDLVDTLLNATENLKERDERFPDSAHELRDKLAQEVSGNEYQQRNMA